MHVVQQLPSSSNVGNIFKMYHRDNLHILYVLQLFLGNCTDHSEGLIINLVLMYVSRSRRAVSTFCCKFQAFSTSLGEEGIGAGKHCFENTITHQSPESRQ